MTVKKVGDIDQLSKIYENMDEMGKEKLKEVSKQILKIWNTVNEEKPDNLKPNNEKPC
jgi:exonuclease VII small subunit